MADYDLFAVVVPAIKGIDSLYYGVPCHLTLTVGQLVKIMIRRRPCHGIVIALETYCKYVVEPILDTVYSMPLLTKNLIALGKWMHNYYCTELSRCFSAMLPIHYKATMPQKKMVIANIETTDLLKHANKLSAKYPSRAKLLEIIAEHNGSIMQSQLAQLAPSIAPLKTLIKHGLVSINYTDPLIDMEFIPSSKKALSSEQQSALKAINEDISKGHFATHLLHGITGSGKTEIYVRAISHAMSYGKSIILLVPEVSLTSQIIKALSQLKTPIAIINHKCGMTNRFHTWQKILSGEYKIVVGARSAIFAPPKNLGLIIVDEEHDKAYKQEDKMPCYHSRDIAILRGKCECATVILGSATPSTVTYSHAINGKYKMHRLTCRPSGIFMPKITIVDMSTDRARADKISLLSNELIIKLKTCISRGEQAMLFLNRKGYYSYRKCQQCLELQKCDHCDISMTYYKGSNTLSCHLCGLTDANSDICKYCHARSIQHGAFGTEHIQRALAAALPQIETLRMDGDTTKKKGSHEHILSTFGSGGADILIGTSMISKGLHFENVTLVGILGIDSLLNTPSFNANEESFATIAQVAGRCGRGIASGEVILQTSFPHLPTIQYAACHDYHTFFTTDVEERKRFEYPPFVYLAKITFHGKSILTTQTYGNIFRKEFISHAPSTTKIFPLIPSGCAKRCGNFFFHFVIKYINSTDFSTTIAAMKKSSRNKVKITINVNPYSIY